MDNMGRRLRILRESRGLSQEALGSTVGIGQSTISEIERGVITPSIEVLIRLARHFDVQPGFFLDSEPTPQPA